MILLEGFLTVAVFLLVLGGLILVHELGHYLMGRLQGFAIEAFSIGFGPMIAEWKGAYNRWQLRWILMGGFVKFQGESGEGEPAGGGPGRPFYAMARWRRPGTWRAPAGSARRWRRRMPGSGAPR